MEINQDLISRKGKITISRKILRCSSYEVLECLFSNFFPVSINHDYSYIHGKMEYFGYSKHFESVEEAVIAPEYEIRINTDPETGKFISLSFNKL